MVIFSAVFSGFLLPAEAGIFSIFSSLLKEAVKEENHIIKNSQNLELLRAAMNLDPNPAKGGGEISIAGGSALVAEAGPAGGRGDIAAKPKQDQISVYVVREGDSLSQIAQMFGVTINTILWANDIGSKGIIHEGQTLVILPVSGIQHKVSSGDTIAKIAKKYDADAEEIKKFNDIGDGYTLRVGEEIVVPNGTKSSSFVPSVGRVVRGASGPSYAGYYLRPIEGGRRSQGLHGYNAVDLATYNGAPISAAAGGEVLISRTGWNGGYGSYIVIAHANGTQTLYAHNSRNIVFAGQSVVQGQVIGYVGTTGRSTGPHVHFEVRGAKNPF